MTRETKPRRVKPAPEIRVVVQRRAVAPVAQLDGLADMLIDFIDGAALPRRPLP